MTILFGRFYVDATVTNPTEKNAVYVKGITPPIWVAFNEDAAKEGARRLNAADRVGALKGWNEKKRDSLGLVTGIQKGWSIDDLIASAKGGDVPRAAIKQAGTLMKAIAAVANGKTSFK
jgi:hypothetical protein